MVRIVNTVGTRLPGVVTALAQQKSKSLARVITARPFRKTFLYTSDSTQDVFVIIVQLGITPKLDRVIIANGNEFRIIRAVNEPIGQAADNYNPTVTWKGGIPPFRVELQYNNPADGGFLDSDTTGMVVNINAALTDGTGVSTDLREYVVSKLNNNDPWWADDLQTADLGTDELINIQRRQNAIGISISDNSSPPRVLFAPFAPDPTYGPDGTTPSGLFAKYPAGHFGPPAWCVPIIQRKGFNWLEYDRPITVNYAYSLVDIPGTTTPLAGTYGYWLDSKHTIPVDGTLAPYPQLELFVTFQADDALHYHRAEARQLIDIKRRNYDGTLVTGPISQLYTATGGAVINGAELVGISAYHESNGGMTVTGVTTQEFMHMPISSTRVSAGGMTLTGVTVQDYTRALVDNTRTSIGTMVLTGVTEQIYTRALIDNVRTSTGAMTLSGVTTQGGDTGRTSMGTMTLAGVTLQAVDNARSSTGTMGLTGITIQGGDSIRASIGAMTLMGITTQGGDTSRTSTGSMTLTGATFKCVDNIRTSTGTMTLTGSTMLGGDNVRTSTGTMLLTGITTQGTDNARTSTGTMTLTGVTAQGIDRSRISTGTMVLTGVTAQGADNVRASIGALTLTGITTQGGDTSRTSTGAMTLAGVTTQRNDNTRTSTGTMTLTGITAQGGDNVRTSTGAMILTGITTQGTEYGRTSSGAITLTGTTTQGVDGARTSTGAMIMTGVTAQIYTRATVDTVRTSTGSMVLAGITRRGVVFAASGGMVINGVEAENVSSYLESTGTMSMAGVTSQIYTRATLDNVRSSTGSMSVTGTTIRGVVFAASGGMVVNGVETVTTTEYYADNVRTSIGTITFTGTTAQEFIRTAVDNTRSSTGSMTLTGSTTQVYTRAAVDNTRTSTGTMTLTGATTQVYTRAPIDNVRTSTGAMTLTGVTVRGVTFTATGGAVVNGVEASNMSSYMESTGAMLLMGVTTQGGDSIRTSTGSMTLAGVTSQEYTRTNIANTRNSTGTMTLAGVTTQGIDNARTSTGVMTLTGVTSQGTDNIRTSNGAIYLTGTTAQGGDSVRTSTGAMTLTGVTTQGIDNARTSNGVMTLTGVTTQGGDNVRTSTGTLTLTGATSQGSDNVRTSTGTLTLSGVTTQGIDRSRTSTGAMTLAGVTTQGIDNARTSTGAITLTGVTNQGTDNVRTSTGTLAMVGVTTQGIDRSRTSSGAMTLSGITSRCIVFNATGGAVVNGIESVGMSSYFESNGGMILTGSTTQDYTRAAVDNTRTSTGSMTLAGATSQEYTRTLVDNTRTSTGSMTLAGTTSQEYTRTLVDNTRTSTGAMNFAGKTVFGVVFNTSGGAVVNGVESVNVSSYFTSTGALMLTGVTAQGADNLRSSAGAMTLTGTTNQGYTRSLVTNDIISTGAMVLTGTTTRGIAFTATGGAVVSGTETVGISAYYESTGSMTLTGVTSQDYTRAVISNTRTSTGAMTVTGVTTQEYTRAVVSYERNSSGTMTVTGVTIPEFLNERTSAGAMTITGVTSQEYTREVVSNDRTSSGTMTVTGVTTQEYTRSVVSNVRTSTGTMTITGVTSQNTFSLLIPDVYFILPDSIVEGQTLTAYKATSSISGLQFTYHIDSPSGSIIDMDAPQSFNTGLQIYAVSVATILYRSISKWDGVIVQGIPVITWSTPADITHGTALSGTQLNATASIPGTFDYNPPSGTILGVGNNVVLGVTFTPTDSIQYTSASTSVTIVVNKVTSIITWSTPAAITYGTALSGTQLNATASVPGAFVYNPPSGTVLSAGNHTISVTFTPTDTDNYVACSSDIGLTVNKKEMRINANSKTKAYLDTIPALTYWMDSRDYVNGETAVTADITGSPELTCSATSTSDAGVYYLIDVKIGSLQSTNYSFTMNTNYLYITKIDQPAFTVTASNITVGGSIQISVSGAAHGTISYYMNSANGAATINSSGLITGAVVGTYYVYVQKNGDTNYNFKGATSPIYSVSAAVVPITFTLSNDGLTNGRLTLHGGSGSYTWSAHGSFTGLAITSNAGYTNSTYFRVAGISGYNCYSQGGYYLIVDNANASNILVIMYADWFPHLGVLPVVGECSTQTGTLQGDWEYAGGVLLTILNGTTSGEYTATPSFGWNDYGTYSYNTTTRVLTLTSNNYWTWTQGVVASDKSSINFSGTVYVKQ